MSADEEGIRAARRFAEWHLGDAAWGSAIVGAYLHPEESMRALEAEIADS